MRIFFLFSQYLINLLASEKQLKLGFCQVFSFQAVLRPPTCNITKLTFSPVARDKQQQHFIFSGCLALQRIETELAHNNQIHNILHKFLSKSKCFEWPINVSSLSLLT